MTSLYPLEVMQAPELVLYHTCIDAIELFNDADTCITRTQETCANSS